MDIHIYIHHRSENGVAWLWHPFLNLYIWLTISSCYGPFDLGLIRRDGGLSTLCHSCRFACQQSVLKTFPGPGSLRFEDTSITSNNIASNAPRYFWNQFSIDLEKFCYSVFLFNVRKQLSTFSVAFGSRISDRLQYHSLTRSARKTNVFVLYLSLQMNDEYIRLKRTDHKFNSIIVLSASVSFSWRKTFEKYYFLLWDSLPDPNNEYIRLQRTDHNFAFYHCYIFLSLSFMNKNLRRGNIV